MTTDKDQALTIRLPRELHRQLKQRAEAEERTIAGVLRLLASEYVRSEEASPLGRTIKVG